MEVKALQNQKDSLLVLQRRDLIFAVSVLEVQEIGRIPDLTLGSCRNPLYRGAFVFHGEPVSLYDLVPHSEESITPDQTCFCIFRSADPIGIVVDELLGIHPWPEEVTETLDPQSAFSAIATIGNRAISLVDRKRAESYFQSESVLSSPSEGK